MIYYPLITNQYYKLLLFSFFKYQVRRRPCVATSPSVCGSSHWSDPVTDWPSDLTLFSPPALCSQLISSRSALCTAFFGASIWPSKLLSLVTPHHHHLTTTTDQITSSHHRFNVQFNQLSNRAATNAHWNPVGSVQKVSCAFAASCYRRQKLAIHAAVKRLNVRTNCDISDLASNTCIFIHFWCSFVTHFLIEGIRWNCLYT